MFRALRNRNFQLFFGGQIISLVGTWMQTVAEAWLIYRLTGSGALLGVLGFVGPDSDLPALAAGGTRGGPMAATARRDCDADVLR